VNDLLGGHIDMIVLDVSVLLPHIRSGAIKALGIAAPNGGQWFPMQVHRARRRLGL